MDLFKCPTCQGPVEGTISKQGPIFNCVNPECDGKIEIEQIVEYLFEHGVKIYQKKHHCKDCNKGIMLFCYSLYEQFNKVEAADVKGLDVLERFRGPDGPKEMVEVEKWMCDKIRTIKERTVGFAENKVKYYNVCPECKTLYTKPELFVDANAPFKDDAAYEKATLVKVERIVPIIEEMLVEDDDIVIDEEVIAELEKRVRGRYDDNRESHVPAIAAIAMVTTNRLAIKNLIITVNHLVIENHLVIKDRLMIKKYLNVVMAKVDHLNVVIIISKIVVLMGIENHMRNVTAKITNNKLREIKKWG